MSELKQEEMMLRNLLAVIYKDGGHYATKYGLQKATLDAIEKLESPRFELSQPTEIFINKLLDGGQIVSSNDCSEMEITFARTNNAFLVIDSFGFVYRTKEQTRKIQLTSTELRGDLVTISKRFVGQAFDSNGYCRYCTLAQGHADGCPVSIAEKYIDLPIASNSHNSNRDTEENSQPLISDEEIEKMAEKDYPPELVPQGSLGELLQLAWIRGAKTMRDQIRSLTQEQKYSYYKKGVIASQTEMIHSQADDNKLFEHDAKQSFNQLIEEEKK